MEQEASPALPAPPQVWNRLGVMIKRGALGEFDASVTGDPCIVWDEALQNYRMFYFAQNKVESIEHCCNAQALAVVENGNSLGKWRKLGPIVYENPGALCGETHKPWILMDPFRPNHPARVDGLYWLLTVSWKIPNKVVQVATSTSLAGPWKIQPHPVLQNGSDSDFDGLHIDAVTAYWFEQRQEILIYYMGYPREAQNDQPCSPWGSSSAVAILRPGEPEARKLGKIITPHPQLGHWISGYIGGVQIVPALDGGWYAILNASPTSPASVEDDATVREPAPSLGGWAFTSEQFPTKGWQIHDQPIEWLEDIPEAAVQAGESGNLWRHHLVLVPNDAVYMFYNTGPYGNEQIFARYAKWPQVIIQSNNG